MSTSNRVELVPHPVGVPWMVTHGNETVFVGGRPAAKRAAADYCRKAGLASWWNCKATGGFVEVKIPA